MLEIIKAINSDYAGVLSLLSSIIMVIVTIVYVGHTKRQADYAKKSVELVAQQMKTDKQPCIIPFVTDSHGSTFATTDYTRIQLCFDIKLQNVGEAPAINVYALADIELQFTNKPNGEKKILHAALLPEFVQAISVKEEAAVGIHFETAEVRALIRELETASELNCERIRTNPSRHPYVGAKLIVRVFFKNTMGQWYESVHSRDIAWLSYKNPPRRKTHNLNENTIPPKTLRDGDKFKAVLVSQHMSPFTYKMTTDDHVNSILQSLTEESPWISDVLSEK